MSAPAPIKVTDLVQKSLDELAHANGTTGEEALRYERKAHIYEGLAGAQSAKTANIIAYLNSDRSTWSETDEEVVRIMLGLPSLSGDDGGTPAADDERIQPPTPSVSGPATEESDSVEDLEPQFIEEPSFA